MMRLSVLTNTSPLYQGLEVLEDQKHHLKFKKVDWFSPEGHKPPIALPSQAGGEYSCGLGTLSIVGRPALMWRWSPGGACASWHPTTFAGSACAAAAMMAVCM